MTPAVKLDAISSTSQHLRLCRPILKAGSLLHRSQPILYLITTRFVVGQPSRSANRRSRRRAYPLSVSKWDSAWRQRWQRWPDMDRGPDRAAHQALARGLERQPIAAELGGDVSRNSVLGKANRLELVATRSKEPDATPRKPDRLMAPLQVARPNQVQPCRRRKRASSPQSARSDRRFRRSGCGPLFKMRLCHPAA